MRRRGLVWRCAVALLAEVAALAGVGTVAQTVSQSAPRAQQGSMDLDTVAKPLLSIDSLRFLEGTWTADAGDKAKPLGSYAWVRELNGKILARHTTTDVACATPATGVCTHSDLLYVFQDSTGAPLKAIYFDGEGHVIRYDVEIRREGGAFGEREYAIFLSDISALGPRYRLTYERNTDTFTGKTSMAGKFEVLLPNNVWTAYLRWGGGLVGAK